MTGIGSASPQRGRYGNEDSRENGTEVTDGSNSALSMASGLLIALCTSVNAVVGKHHAKSGYVIVPPSKAVIPNYFTPGGARIYRDDTVPGGLRTDHDAPPAYDDPSKFGGA